MSVTINKVYMQLALSLAKMGLGFTSPNPMVGAVIVKDGQIIGQGYHQKAGTPHAEVHALREAGYKARGATLYVTLEPCVHFGRTPPCTDAIIQAGIKHVIIAARDPNPLVAGRGIQKLQDAGITLTVGFMEQEALRLNEVFNKFITTALPFVVLKSAITLDGKIATAAGHSQWITGEEARQYGHRLRHQYDAILVGVGTVIADNPKLTTRLYNTEGKNPIRVILDSTARIPLSSHVLTDNAAETIIAVTPEAPEERIKALSATGVKVVVMPSCDGRVDFGALITELGSRGITAIFIEGGATVNAAALRANLVDKIHFFIAPKIIGDHAAPGPFASLGINNLEHAVKLSIGTVEKIGDDLHIEAYVVKENDPCLLDSLRKLELSKQL
mgnify:CR=1 FL=1